MFKALITWHHQRETERQLSMLTDRELNDIGIERADIGQIARFDPAADKRRAAAKSSSRSPLSFSQAQTRA